MAELAHECTRLHELAWKNFQQRNLQGAVQACSELNQRFPRFADGWFLGSQIATKLGNLEKALEFAELASELSPNELLYSVHRASCLLFVRRISDALALAEEIEAANPQDAAVFAGLATVYTGCGDTQASLRCNEQAVTLSPQNAGYHYNLAATQRFLGHLSAAEKSYDRTLALDPHEYEAYLMRAELSKQTEDSNHVAEIENILAEGVRSWQGEVQLCFALAKEHDDLGQYDESFDYLKRGADLKRRQSEYDFRADLTTVDRLIEIFDKALVEESDPGFDSQEPIFVLGLPRTGTTLVERILSCHDDVISAGELNNFAIELVKMTQATAGGRRLSRWELLEKSAGIEFSDLGRAYVQSTRPQTGSTRHFIDKLPANYLYCALIHLALPNSKIISLVRDPMDTCYAIYKTLFKAAYPFSYDLDEIARYFVAYRRLMDHWSNLLPGRILEVRYEDLVADQEGQSRRILEHCDLSWDPDVLNFHTSAEATTTASAVQVRQPIYSSSIGKWRSYEKHLRSVAQILDDAGVTYA